MHRKALHQDPVNEVIHPGAFSEDFEAMPQLISCQRPELRLSSKAIPMLMSIHTQKFPAEATKVAAVSPCSNRLGESRFDHGQALVGRHAL